MGEKPTVDAFTKSRRATGSHFAMSSGTKLSHLRSRARVPSSLIRRRGAWSATGPAAATGSATAVRFLRLLGFLLIVVVQVCRKFLCSRGGE